MPDNQDKKPQTETKASQDKSSANATVEARTIAGGGGQSEQAAEKANIPDDRAAQASQAAQHRKRDDHGRFATDDDTREPQRASRQRSRQDDDYRGRYDYNDDPRRASSRRDYNDYEARDRGQRNLFEDQDDYRRRERAPSRDDDQRGRWASQGYGHSQSHDDFERYSREYGDDYRRYSNQERRPDRQRDSDERYDQRYNYLGGGWAQSGQRYEDDRATRRSGWVSQGDQQRNRDWERDERGGYSNARRDYEEFDGPRHRSYRDLDDDYSRRFQQDRYEEERRRDYTGAKDRTRYQYNDYRPVDQESSRYEQRRYERDDRYEQVRGPRRRDDW